MKRMKQTKRSRQLLNVSTGLVRNIFFTTIYFYRQRLLTSQTLQVVSFVYSCFSLFLVVNLFLGFNVTSSLQDKRL